MPECGHFGRVKEWKIFSLSRRYVPVKKFSSTSLTLSCKINLCKLWQILWLKMALRRKNGERQLPQHATLSQLRHDTLKKRKGAHITQSLTISLNKGEKCNSAAVSNIHRAQTLERKIPATVFFLKLNCDGLRQAGHGDSSARTEGKGPSFVFSSQLTSRNYQVELSVTAQPVLTHYDAQKLFSQWVSVKSLLFFYCSGTCTYICQQWRRSAESGQWMHHIVWQTSIHSWHWGAAHCTHVNPFGRQQKDSNFFVNDDRKPHFPSQFNSAFFFPTKRDIEHWLRQDGCPIMDFLCFALLLTDSHFCWRTAQLLVTLNGVEMRNDPNPALQYFSNRSSRSIPDSPRALQQQNKESRSMHCKKQFFPCAHLHFLRQLHAGHIECTHWCRGTSINGQQSLTWANAQPPRWKLTCNLPHLPNFPDSQTHRTVTTGVFGQRQHLFWCSRTQLRCQRWCHSIKIPLCHYKMTQLGVPLLGWNKGVK